MSQSPCHSRHFLTALLRRKFRLPAGYTYTWSGEYEFEVRAKDRLKVILPVVFFVIFVLLYMIFHSATKAMVLIFPTFYAMTGGLILQRLLGYNLNVAVWGGLYRAILALRLRRAWSWSYICTKPWTIAWLLAFQCAMRTSRPP